MYTAAKLAVLTALIIVAILPTGAFCQEQVPATGQPAIIQSANVQPVGAQTNDGQTNGAQTGNAQPDKRIFWLIANYRTSATLARYTPLTTSQKFNIARQDTFDRGTVALAGLVAGEAQLTNANPSFGQGIQGYAHYFGTTYADFAIGNYMTEAIFPTILHQDPRYFRRGNGSKFSRLAYSAGQVFLTHGDSGQTEFNFSEIAGNSAAVAISMAYYPNDRDVGDAVSRFGFQIGTDMASNILKEFGPDIMHKFSRKHHEALASK